MSDESSNKKNSFAELFSSVSPETRDLEIGALQEAIESEKDDRREERFYWILTTVILIDLMAFPHLHWAGVIGVFLLEIVLLVGLARRLGVKGVVILLEKLFSRFNTQQ
ncbi:MAG: hypothetical protein V3V55_03740 [Rhodospirillales bacterium]